ncbi:unnamed protein product [Gongylonema pulchrum]|uniref:Uncharacterized protein n=1 Tax=Gongylonema pulchrum TaxID=637853 RepID=A0A183EZW6_9BILA|nr:unnamed protein product [Gongylonema pulchrum]
MKDDSRTEARSSPQSICSASSARPQSPPAAGTNHDKPQSPDGEASNGPQSPRIVEEGEIPQSTGIGTCHEVDQHETPKSPEQQELNPEQQPQAIAEISARKEAVSFLYIWDHNVIFVLFRALALAQNLTENSGLVVYWKD